MSQAKKSRTDRRLTALSDEQARDVQSLIIQHLQQAKTEPSVSYDARFVPDETSQSEIRAFVLSNRLGLIPHPAGDYLSVRAIAAILGREEATVKNKLPKRLIQRHALGAYFRLIDAIKAIAEYDASKTTQDEVEEEAER